MPIPLPGEPAPPFSAAANDGQILDSDSLAGRFTTLCFFGSAGHPAMAAMMAAITAQAGLFDGVEHQLVGISIDPDDQTEQRLASPMPGVRMLWDFDRTVSQLFGAIESTSGSEVPYQPMTVLLDAGLRVLSVHLIDDPEDHPANLAQFLQSLPRIGPPRPALPQAPVLLVPMVFEMEFCRRLVAFFDETGGQPSGILEDDDEKTVLTIDPARKQRQDAAVTDDTLRQAAQARIRRRLLPEVRKAFQFNATRMERSVIARYGAGDFFGPHRDNGALGTAHRRFAITIPLNADAFRGGLLRFPEYGSQVYPIPTGCALVHSCSLMHEITAVTEGVRYAFIPIVFDEQAARQREANTQYLGAGTSPDRRETAEGGDTAEE